MSENEKQEPRKKQAPQSKPKPKPKARKLVHIERFIDIIRVKGIMSPAQEQGFKAYMTGNHYLKTLDDFVPYLEKYIGKKVG